jgi:hypothetical protein
VQCDEGELHSIEFVAVRKKVINEIHPGDRHFHQEMPKG